MDTSAEAHAVFWLQWPVSPQGSGEPLGASASCDGPQLGAGAVVPRERWYAVSGRLPEHVIGVVGHLDLLAFRHALGCPRGEDFNDGAPLKLTMSLKRRKSMHLPRPR